MSAGGGGMGSWEWGLRLFWWGRRFGLIEEWYKYIICLLGFSMFVFLVTVEEYTFL